MFTDQQGLENLSKNTQENIIFDKKNHNMVALGGHQNKDREDRKNETGGGGKETHRGR